LKFEFERYLAVYRGTGWYRPLAVRTQRWVKNTLLDIRKGAATIRIEKSRKRKEMCSCVLYVALAHILPVTRIAAKQLELRSTEIFTDEINIVANLLFGISTVGSKYHPTATV
jgi:hypothetical protein